jgi:Tol biopolymer transport system component
VEASEPVFPGNAQPNVQWFAVSPDGRLLAFTDRIGNERRQNIFVTKLPDPRERRQITSNGGSRPRFSRDGKSLWYFSPAPQAGAARGQFNVVPLTTDPLTVGAPSVVLVQDAADGTLFPLFDVSADGRLLITRRADSQPGDEARVVLMQNWQATIRK